MSALIVDEVSVHYGSVPALDRFSLEARSGEIVAVLGPSGSGKSTLLRAVAGLEPLTAGRIVLDSRDLAGVPTHRRGLGLMFQDHGLFSHLSVADNIAYGLRIAGASKEARRARVSELLDLVGLEGFEARRADELSGGEAQRVALARALAPEPGLLMLDEPLGSLDRALRDQLTGELRRLLEELGQTALHVTHDQAEAFALADRVVIVDAGRPVADDTPANLWADPGSRFVAEFLGHPNIWSVEVDGGGSVWWSGNALGPLPLDHPLRRSGPGRHLVVMPVTGLRSVPGDADAGFAGSSGASASAMVEVVVVESVFRRGLNDVSAVLTTGGGPTLEPGSRSVDRTDLAVRFTTEFPVRLGDVVMVAIDPSRLQPLDDL